MFEYEPDDEEVGGYDDEQYGKGRQQAMHSHPEEEVEQSDLQEIIDDVRTCEAGSVTGGDVLLEREMG